MGLSKMGGTILRKYGQITIIPKPKFMLFWNDSPTKLPFGVTVGRCYNWPRYEKKNTTSPNVK